MYDSATLPGEQLGEEVLPEPFSRKQRVQSRLDGGEEIDGSSRTSLEVTPSEPPGHVVRERTVAEAELRASRNPYSEVPLTGCQQSALPTYRLPQAFGQIEVPDEHGLWDPRSRAPFCFALRALDRGRERRDLRCPSTGWEGSAGCGRGAGRPHWGESFWTRRAELFLPEPHP